MRFETILQSHRQSAHKFGIAFGEILEQDDGYTRQLMEKYRRQNKTFHARLLKMWEESQNEREWYPLK